MHTEMTKNDKSRNKRDETIGKALSATIVNEVATGSCLTDEELAAIIEGKIADPERDLFMKHLSSCDKCLQVFITSQGLIGNKASHSQRSRFVLPSVGLAVAALLAIIIRMSFQGNTPDKPVEIAQKEYNFSGAQKLAEQPVPGVTSSVPSGKAATTDKPPSASETARILASGGEIKSLLPAIPSEISPVYGFSGVVPNEKIAFRLGVHAADLELLTRANEQEGVKAQLKQITELLQTMQKEQANVAIFAEIAHKIESGTPLKDFEDCTALIENILVSKDELFLYRFGVWAEGGRLAAVTRNKGYVTQNSLKYVMDGTKNMQLPSGMSNALQEINLLLKKDTFSGKDFLVMKRAFEDVVTIF